jgi:O-antigen ligase
MMFQFFLGAETRIFIGPEHLVRVEGIEGLFGARVKPPGEQLIFIMLLVAFSLVGTGLGKHWKRRYLLFSGILSVGLVITFTRSVWIAAIFGLVVICYYLHGQERKRLILNALSVILPMVVIFLAINVAFVLIGNTESNQLNLVTKRLLSVFNAKAYGKEGSFGTRTMEFEKASPYIKSHPILGVGFNNPYRLGWRVDGYYPYSYVHNGYLFIMLKMGILGLICYIWLSIAFLRRATRIYRQISDEYFKGLVLGSIVGYSGVLLTNITFPTFWEYAMVPCIAIFMGLNEVICKIEKCNYPDQNL